jgi:hypothetical protein
MAAKIAMIATTIIISIRVSPLKARRGAVVANGRAGTIVVKPKDMRLF